MYPASASSAAVDRADLVDEIEARIIALGGIELRDGIDHPEIPIAHRFADGMYAREMFIPMGSVAVSKIHKTEHFFVVSRGKIAVLGDDGWSVIEAPYTGTTKPGTRRVGVAIEDTVWTTFHPTTLRDVAEIEAEIIEPHTNPLLAEPTRNIAISEAAQ